MSSTNSSEWSDLLLSLAGLGIGEEGGGGNGAAAAAAEAAEAAEVAVSGASPAAALQGMDRSLPPSPIMSTPPPPSHLAPFFDFGAFHGAEQVSLSSLRGRERRENDSRRG